MMAQPKLIDVGDLMADCLKKSTTKDRIQQGFKDPSTLSRVKYFYKLLREFKLIDHYTVEPKNNGRSTKSRNSGNKMFLLNRFNEALDLYNEAICWAEPNNGEELALAYGNRSAVYFEWKEYNLCRENIKLAKYQGFPDRLMQKLEDRDAQCIAKLSQPKNEQKEKLKVNLSIDGPSPVSEIESMHPLPIYSYEKYHGEAALSLMPMSKYPYAANCLEVKYDAKKSQRVVVTNVDLKPGQIISVEMPILSSVTMKDRCYRYRKCAKCYDENYLSLIPCPSCANTMYCSQKCMDDSFKHHQYECPISEFLLTFCSGDTLSIRILLEAYASFISASDLDEFCKSYDETESQLDPEQFSYRFDEGMSAEDKYRHLHGFETNERQRDDDNLLQCYCKAASLYYLLTQKTAFVDLLKTEANHDNLMKLLMRHVQISNTNSITCTQYKDFDVTDAGDDKSINIYSEGIYPLASLLKHSCAPNVLMVSNGPKVIAYVSRVIKKGSQLTRSMGIQNIHYFQHTKRARQEMLDHYSVKCDCEACVDNYPTHVGLPEGKLPNSYNFVLNMRYLILDLEVKNLDKFLEILHKYNNKLPCLSLNELQLRVHKIMKLKYGDIATSLKMSFKLHPLAQAQAGQ